MTHFHHDHIQGLPFFEPILRPENTVVFHSPVEELEEHVRGIMRFPYHPVEMRVLPAKVEFDILRSPRFQLAGLSIQWRPMRHGRSGSHSYRFSCGGRTIIFATDAEIGQEDFVDNEMNRSYFDRADLLILDAQYTLEESLNKADWGHTSYSLGVDLASRWKIGTLALFHHEPQYTDKKVYGMLRSAQWYLKHLENTETQIILAREGLELEYL